MELPEKRCETCAFHDRLNWVCFNGKSYRRADFTMATDSCSAWSKKTTGEITIKSGKKRAESAETYTIAEAAEKALIAELEKMQKE